MAMQTSHRISFTLLFMMKWKFFGFSQALPETLLPLVIVCLMHLYSSIHALDKPNPLTICHSSTTCLNSSKPSLSSWMSTESILQWNSTSESLRTWSIIAFFPLCDSTALKEKLDCRWLVSRSYFNCHKQVVRCFTDIKKASFIDLIHPFSCVLQQRWSGSISSHVI